MCGWSLDGAEMRARSAAIVEAKKRFNVREGWTRDEDTLPARFLQEPLESPEISRLQGDGVSLSRQELDRMIRGYYRARGWTDDGSVPPERAAALGLGGLA